MENYVSLADFLKRRSKGCNQLRWQIGDKPDCVGQNCLFDRWQGNRTHSRVERGEEQILRHHVSTCQAIEKRGFARIGIANQRDDGPRRPSPPRAVKLAGLADLLQLTPQSGHALADHTPVRFDLSFARSAQKSEAAALAFQVRPTAHKPALLIV